MVQEMQAVYVLYVDRILRIKSSWMEGSMLSADKFQPRR